MLEDDVDTLEARDITARVLAEVDRLLSEPYQTELEDLVLICDFDLPAEYRTPRRMVLEAVTRRIVGDAWDWKIEQGVGGVAAKLTLLRRQR